MTNNLMIAVPMMDMVPTDFFANFQQLDRPDDTPLFMTKSSLIYDARNWLYDRAVKNNYEWIFWLDSDMICPTNAIPRMMQIAKENKVEFVTGLYMTRKKPVIPVIAKTLDWWQVELTGETYHALEVYKDYPRDSLFEVAGCGFGCALTSTEMLRKITKEYQTNPFDPLPQLGEDYSMCWKARQLNYRILCDSTIKCGHIGQYIFTEADYEPLLRKQISEAQD